MLKITEISKTFNQGTINEKRALCKVSLTMQDGDFATIVGSNGAGKSTPLLQMKVRSFWMVKTLRLKKSTAAAV